MKLAKMTPGHIINAKINDLLHHGEFKLQDKNKKNKAVKKDTNHKQRPFMVNGPYDSLWLHILSAATRQHCALSIIYW